MQTLADEAAKRSRYLTFLQPLIILLFAVANLLWGEILPVKGGFGWDGGIYRNLTREYQEKFADRSFHPYYLQRILPSIVVSGRRKRRGKETGERIEEATARFPPEAFLFASSRPRPPPRPSDSSRLSLFPCLDVETSPRVRLVVMASEPR